MTPLLLIRHGPTIWNGEGRLQGQTDIPLSDAGRAAVERWRIPSRFHNYDMIVSPLQRCVETAALLCRTLADPPTPRPEPRLKETSWGDWEGRTLDELRASEGEGMAVNERCGVDFRPPGGESPRDVQARVRPVLAELGAAGQPTIAVIHRGVMRAIYAIATGWDMTEKPPHRLLHKMPHGYALLFELAADGTPRLVEHDLPLVEPAADPTASPATAPTRTA